MSKYTLSIGIVGLPNVGKSTLFNALLKRQVALAANYPFATIEPNVGVVEVPDERLQKLAELVKAEFSKSTDTRQVPEKVIPAVVEFYDIAGLVKGASKGEGLGNKFLSHIREVNAILHLVRDFEDTNVIREGSVTPSDDISTINTELVLADLQTLEKRIQKHNDVLKRDKSKINLDKEKVYLKLLNQLNSGELINKLGLTEEEQEQITDLNLLTSKPFLYVFNVDEKKLGKAIDRTGILGSTSSLNLNAKVEAELSSLSKEDQGLYLQELGLNESGLDVVIKTSYEMLGLQTFLTAGPKEVRAWTIKQGTHAPQAAGVIHTDFERGFIRAQIVSYEDLLSSGSYKQAKANGVIRLEGKDYVMQDGDVVEFKFSV